MQPMLKNAKIKMASLDKRLSGSRIYQVLKTRLASLILAMIVMGVVLIGPFKLEKINYKPLSNIHQQENSNNIDNNNNNNNNNIPEPVSSPNFGKVDSSYDKGSSKLQNQATSNQQSPKLIFVNNKYPTAIGYENILNTMDPDAFVQYPTSKKCEIYFKELYNKTPTWYLEELEAGYGYNGYIFDTKEAFINDRKNEFKSSLKKKDDEEISEEELNKQIEEKGKKFEWDAKYAEAYKESEDTETYMTSQMTNLRVFSQCYLDSSLDPKEQDLIDNMHPNITCEENEKRLFKFLTKKLPTYTRWNKETIETLPDMSKYLKDVKYKTDISQQDSHANETLCFTRSLMNSYNGQGIAISAMDKHVDELSSLILVLRALNNKLPIQIVHRGDLSEKSQDALIKASRSLDLNFDSLKSFKAYIQTKFENVRKLDLETIFPKQEIWFVNTTSAINPADQRFISYGNKLLTLLFSSFEDTVLIDTDTVPFVDIEEFILNSEAYKEKGAFFFKDRQLYDRITGPELTYFKKLLPNRLDNAFFQIPELTNFTMENRFFGEKYKHVQESGMVAINKKRHMRSTLTINVLQMWHAATTRVHGDKELFWLGFTIAGDEDYYMNKYGVGAVGQVNPNSNRLLGDSDDSRRSKLKSHQVCTTHPAHLSGLDDHTLLWMNSGFIDCKRENEAEKDITMDLYKNMFENAQQLKETYMGPLKISAVLVPPPQERVINNDLGEPASGWEVMFGCGGYLYCAYDVIGGSNDTFYQGTLVEYDTEQQLIYDYLGELWVYMDKVMGNKK